MVKTRTLHDEYTPLLPTQRDGQYSEKYAQIYDIHDPTTTFPVTPRHTPLRSTRLRNGLLVILVSFILLFSKHVLGAFHRGFSANNNTTTTPHVLSTSTSPIVDSDDYDSGAPFAPLEVQRQWGAYAPYYSVEPYQPPPKDCQLTQVNIVRFLHKRNFRKSKTTHIKLY